MIANNNFLGLKRHWPKGALKRRPYTEKADARFARKEGTIYRAPTAKGRTLTRLRSFLAAVIVVRAEIEKDQRDF